MKYSSLIGKPFLCLRTTDHHPNIKGKIGIIKSRKFGKICSIEFFDSIQWGHRGIRNSCKDKHGWNIFIKNGTIAVFKKEIIR